MRLHLMVHGRVQGVGFRYYALNCARRHSLTGWVRNCSNGDVECEVQGRGERVEEFVKEIEAGPMFARVREVQRTDQQDIADEKNFEIRA